MYTTLEKRSVQNAECLLQAADRVQMQTADNLGIRLFLARGQGYGGIAEKDLTQTFLKLAYVEHPKSECYADWIIHNATERHITESQSISTGGKLFSVVILGLLFHRRAQRIGQKTELSLLKVFAALLLLHFHKCCLFCRIAFRVTSVARTLASNRN